MRRLNHSALVALFVGLLARSLSAAEPVEGLQGWRSASPRDELKPTFVQTADGHQGSPSLWIEHDQREGLDGYWTKEFSVTGGKYYSFRAFRKTDGVTTPRRSTVVRLLWRDAQGKQVLRDEAAATHTPDPLARYVTDVLPGYTPTAEAEYPLDKGADGSGWAEVAEVYRAPSGANKAIVELHLQWSPRSKVAWSDISLKETAAPNGRKVRLASVHFRPKEGHTPAEKCRSFEPFIEQAAREKADLVVLPETLTYFSTGLSYAECAEPIPGPSTEYFGALAKKHNLYIVAGLLERNQHLVHNVAVLLAPDGTVAGKYRKVCLPRDEVAGGIAPGNEYPVFKTRFGMLGMMVCYDGFFPEVARELSNHGAEVIAWPVWGCNPMLASARACENHVYLVSSTYEDVGRKWMLSGIWDHEGNVLAKAEMFGSVVMAEVDLDQRLQWPSLGDFKADLARHRPLSADEVSAK